LVVQPTFGALHTDGQFDGRSACPVASSRKMDLISNDVVGVEGLEPPTSAL
jgi:hypothetical protein